MAYETAIVLDEVPEPSLLQPVQAVSAARQQEGDALGYLHVAYVPAVGGRGAMEKALVLGADDDDLRPAVVAGDLCCLQVRHDFRREHLCCGDALLQGRIDLRFWPGFSGSATATFRPEATAERNESGWPR